MHDVEYITHSTYLYTDHYSNPDIRPRRMIVPTYAKSYAMDYRDHSYNNFNLGLFYNQVMCTIEICLNLYVLENIDPEPFS
jgi:hypothetical protein